jgi:methionyl-tRNA synthetase
VLIPAGHQIKKAKLLFQKIENSQIEYQRSKLNNSEKENQLKSIRAVKPVTSFKNFDSLDLQVAEIIDVKKVKKNKKINGAQS